MRRAREVISADAMAGHHPIDRVVLDYDGRHRRRIVIETASGKSILLDLDHARHLRHGDGLALEDGSVILVEAAPEALLEITAESAPALLRLAWHLGNRHLPAQLGSHSIRIRADHVIADMIRGLGGTVTPIQAPFDPEGGAYSQAVVHSHGHDGHHSHGHDSHHSHDHSHGHRHG